jgi:hypothetical protein
MNFFTMRTVVPFALGMLFAMFLLPWIQTQWASFRK